MSEIPYGYVRRLTDTGFDAAVSRVTEALKAEGFGVLTEIDVQATLKKKIDVDFRPYKILGACNPKLAHRALSGEPHIGLLLPCNVVVQDAGDGAVDVSIADPKAMFEIVGNDAAAGIADEVAEKLKRVIAALG